VVNAISAIFRKLKSSAFSYEDSQRRCARGRAPLVCGYTMSRPVHAKITQTYMQGQSSAGCVRGAASYHWRNTMQTAAKINESTVAVPIQ